MAKKSFKFPTDVFLFNIIRIIFPMRLNKALLILNGRGGGEEDHQTFFFSAIALGVRVQVWVAGRNNWKQDGRSKKGTWGEGGREEGLGR